MFTLPASDEHTTIVGRNGSGKTQMGAWLLSKQDLKAGRWLIVDYKGDELLNSIPFVKEVDYKTLPEENGLFILHARPDHDEDVDDMLWRIWEQGDFGIYIDEGYNIPGHRKSAYETLLVQGRSLRIPIITLSQRPVRVNRGAFSEASHIAVFHLNDRRDIATVQELLPEDFMYWLPDDFAPFSQEGKLPPYHCRWYSVKTDEKFLLRPVPDANTIRNEITEKLRPPEPPSWRDRMKAQWSAFYG